MDYTDSYAACQHFFQLLIAPTARGDDSANAHDSYHEVNRKQIKIAECQGLITFYIVTVSVHCGAGDRSVMDSGSGPGVTGGECMGYGETVERMSEGVYKRRDDSAAFSGGFC
jgi:hypothetical protein